MTKFCLFLCPNTINQEENERNLFQDKDEKHFLPVLFTRVSEASCNFNTLNWPFRRQTDSPLHSPGFDSPQKGQELPRTSRKLLIILLKPTVVLFPIDQDSWPRNPKRPGKPPKLTKNGTCKNVGIRSDG